MVEVRNGHVESDSFLQVRGRVMDVNDNSRLLILKGSNMMQKVDGVLGPFPQQLRVLKRDTQLLCFFGLVATTLYTV